MDTPLREDPERVLAYDEEKHVFILKLDSSQLNTVRASLKIRAENNKFEIIAGVSTENPAEELSDQIEQEVRLFIAERSESIEEEK